jgi:hypothetical protein
MGRPKGLHKFKKQNSVTLKVETAIFRLLNQTLYRVSRTTLKLKEEEVI